MKYGERFNTATHFLASETADPWKITSVAVYGTTLFILYLSWTIYHGHKGKFKKHFQKLDHLSIYFLIAGTYTPFMLVTLNGAWGLAVIGIVLDTTPNNKQKKRINESLN